MKGNIVVDPNKCISCHSCEISCAVEHSVSKNLYLAAGEYPRPQKRVVVEHFAQTNLPLQCRHCEDAPCVKVCPTKALVKEGVEGPVLLNDHLCIGCKWCVVACPFGVIVAAPDDNIMIKCDLCQNRLPDEKVQLLSKNRIQDQTIFHLLDQNILFHSDHRHCLGVGGGIPQLH